MLSNHLFISILLILFKSVTFSYCDEDYTINKIKIPDVVLIPEDGAFADSTVMNGTYHTIVKKYDCKASYTPLKENLLLYGSKSWTYPKQDVKLILRYPSENNTDIPIIELQEKEQLNDNIITRATVILHMDGFDSIGYIRSGGMLREHIEMMFTVSRSTQLRYQFWLFGVEKDSIDSTWAIFDYETCY